MLFAVLAAICAAVAVVGIIAAIAIYRQKRSNKHIHLNRDMNQFKTVVGTTPFDNPSVASNVRNGGVVVDDGTAKMKPSDGLRGRIAILGGFAAVVFAALGAKLWNMQIMSNEAYASQAEQNLYTTVTTPAARGIISDVNGLPLVKNKVCQTVLADSDVADDNDVTRKLAAILGLPVNIVKKRIKDTSAGAQSQRVVSSEARMRDVAYIAEHAESFPGVSIESRTMREYPYGALAAHVLGYTAQPTEEQLAQQAEGRTIESTDVVGQAGIEVYYDSVLAGDRGQRRVMVDASGNVLDVMDDIKSTQGCDITLTIDARVQYAADALLAQTIAPNGTIGQGRGVAGSIVVLDVRDGSIVAMSSYPTFDPSYFTGSIPTDIWELYQTDEAFAPLNNRAINGQYAAASTFKAFTSLAGLEEGFADFQSTWVCSGSWDGFGTGDVQRCHLHTGHGTLDLHGGIVNSCDVVFYEIAKAFFDHGPDGTGEISATALQEQIEKFGFGSKTGIDLMGESAGRVPTPEWKAEHWRNVPSEAQWRGGDYTNMIIGQGDVLVTPLQVAVAYGAVATGKLMKPHLLKEVHNAEGEVVVTVEPEVVSEPDVKPEYLEYVRDALHGMVRANSSIASMVDGFGIDAAGKSGTNDNAWFVTYAPFDDPHYVVACVIEEGGGGSAVAAPLAVQILNAAIKAEAGTLDTTPAKLPGSTGKSVPLSYQSASARDD